MALMIAVYIITLPVDLARIQEPEKRSPEYSVFDTTRRITVDEIIGGNQNSLKSKFNGGKSFARADRIIMSSPAGALCKIELMRIVFASTSWANDEHTAGWGENYPPRSS